MKGGETVKIIKKVLAPDGISTKHIQETDDGFVVESTYIRRQKKHSICVSTQVGCVIGCRFCVSGMRSKDMPHRRSLISSEITEECSNVENEIDFITYPYPLTFSFMGEGEPFLNFKECIKALHSLSVGNWPIPVQLSISTSGIRPDLIRLLGGMTFRTPLKLQVSLHGPNDSIRSKIIPVFNSLAEIVAATKFYREKCGRPVTWNYVLCAGINDSLDHAKQVVGLLGPGWHVKFSRLNCVEGIPFLPATKNQRNRFRRVVEDGGISTSYSETDESGIRSGCGQLSYAYSSAVVL